jgi:hypothetical protein
VSVGLVGAERDGPVEAGQRRGGIAGLEQREAVVRVPGRLARVDPHGGGDVAEGRRRLRAGELDETQVVECAGVAPVAGDDLAVKGGSTGDVALPVQGEGPLEAGRCPGRGATSACP